MSDIQDGIEAAIQMTTENESSSTEAYRVLALRANDEIRAIEKKLAPLKARFADCQIIPEFADPDRDARGPINSVAASVVVAFRLLSREPQAHYSPWQGACFAVDVKQDEVSRDLHDVYFLDRAKEGRLYPGIGTEPLLEMLREDGKLHNELAHDEAIEYFVRLVGRLIMDKAIEPPSALPAPIAE